MDHVIHFFNINVGDGVESFKAGFIKYPNTPQKVQPSVGLKINSAAAKFSCKTNTLITNNV
jgi:hypothetical protein